MARRRPFVIYMNGQVASTRTGFFCKRYPKIEPGCQIIVPQKIIKEGRGMAGDEYGYFNGIFGCCDSFFS